MGYNPSSGKEWQRWLGEIEGQAWFRVSILNPREHQPRLDTLAPLPHTAERQGPPNRPETPDFSSGARHLVIGRFCRNSSARPDQLFSKPELQQYRFNK